MQWLKKLKVRKWLLLNKEHTYTFFLAPLFGFLQSFAASIMFILASQDMPFIQYGAGVLYYTVLTANTKRMAFGTVLGITLFILFAALGFVIGTLVTNYFTK